MFGPRILALKHPVIYKKINKGYLAENVSCVY